MSSGTIKIKLHGKYRDVWVSDTRNCKNYKCFHPHDCPTQGARGVRSSKGRYMCLTNVNQGCPEESEREVLALQGEKSSKNALKKAIAKAKPNMDKIDDVDKWLDSIR